MEKSFPIDFVRQVIEQTMLEEHNKKPKVYFGGKNQVNLFSFYEQLQKEDEVNRYVEIYRDLTEQQNRTGLIMNGTLIAPENPTITNLYQCTIIPMTFTCSFRVQLANRDNAINTINNLIKILKGRKKDIAMLDTGELFMVGTIGNGDTLSIRPQDYLCEIADNENISTKINTTITNLGLLGFTNTLVDNDYVYVTYGGKLCVAQKSGSSWEIVTNRNTKGIIFPPIHNSYEKMKVSISCDSVRCDEPRNMNSKEYCVISFGGSATLTNESVLMGNDMVKMGIKRTKIVAKSTINITDTETLLEPLELPSGSNADTQLNQLISNNFVNNSHTDALSISNQYTFILDKSIPIINQWFKYARYGIQANGTTIGYTSGITPNMIYEINEYWSSWGVVDKCSFNAKIVESIDIENTESDTLTISISFQVQGANN